MDWQQLVSLMIVAATAVLLALLLAGKLRRRKFSFERQTHCGCVAGSQATTQGSIIFRARKGQRREVVVKW